MTRASLQQGMRPSRRPGRWQTPSLSMFLLAALLVVLWVAGGASGADVLGQAVVRATTWLLVIAAIMFVPYSKASFSDLRPVFLIVFGGLALVALQLVPLPASWWLALPGRAPFAQAAIAAGELQPWRPLAIVPDAARNAASSLIVPFGTLILIAGLRLRERAWLLPTLLGLVSASAVLALLQFSGAAIDNPFINERAGQVSGSLANRNHFALFTAIGCLMIPTWMFLDGRKPQWRTPVGIGLLLLFILVILASGSRAGILVGVLAVGISLLLVRRNLRRALNRAPRWVLPAGIGLLITAIAAFVVISISAGRAPSIERAFSGDAVEDLRFRALPTVWTMLKTYLPVGIGFGGFDPVFRLHEPFALLKPTYFNHAHDDLLEIVIEGGVAALLLLLLAVVWWIRATIRAWRNDAPLARLGSAIILLVLVSSAFDYPARAPVMMAILAIAGAWLSFTVPPTPALPANSR